MKDPPCLGNPQAAVFGNVSNMVKKLAAGLGSDRVKDGDVVQGGLGADALRAGETVSAASGQHPKEA